VKRLTALLLLLGLTGLSVQAGTPASEKGFVPLFDGKSFAGWKTTDKTPKSWKIEDGLLVLTGGSNNLFTEKEFDDFVVRFEFRPEKKGYNSGFFIRGGNQINLAQKDAGRLFGYNQTRPVPELHKAPGEWNEWEVTCNGPKVTLKVNGQLAWSIDNFKPKHGPIGIQAEGQHIDFRNLRIKMLDKE
jgi:hypothetical protein